MITHCPDGPNPAEPLLIAARLSRQIYPAQQYKSSVTSPALLADLQSLSLKQSSGFDDDAQAAIRAALPIKRTCACSPRRATPHASPLSEG